MLKKIISSLLTAVMLATVVNVALLNVGAAIDLEYSATYNDNFDNAATTAEYMEQTKYSGTADALPDGSTSFAVADGVLKPALTKNLTQYYPMYTFKDNTVTPESFSVDITFSGYVNKDQNQNRIIAYYDPDTGNSVEFSFYRNNDANVYGISHTLKGITADNNKYGSYSTTTSSTQWKNDWVENSQNRYVITYNYFEKEDGTKIIQAIAEFYFNGDFSNVKARRVVNFPVSSFSGFKVGIKGYTLAANVVTYDNLSFKYKANKTDAMLAEEFRTRNAEILKKETVTVSDLDAYNNAMSDYESITESAKLLVADEYKTLQKFYSEMQKNVKDKFYNIHKAIIEKNISDVVIADKNALYDTLEEIDKMSEFEKTAISDYVTKLNLLKGRFTDLNKRYHGDDFENPLYTEECFETSDTSKIYTVEELDGSNWLTVPSGAFTTVKDACWDYTRKVKSVSFDVYAENKNATISFYSLYNPDKNLKNGIKMVSRGTGFNSLSATRIESSATLNKVTVDGTNYQLYLWKDFSDEFGENPQIYTVNADYTYSTAVVDGETVNVIMVAYTIYNSENKVIGTQRGIYKTDDYIGAKIAFSSGASPAVRYDNLKVTFENNDSDAQNISDTFVKKYSSVLNKKYNEIENNDSDTIDKAIAEYNSLDALTQSKLTNTVALLEIQKRYIPCIDTFDSVDVNDINTCISAYKLLKGENDGFRNYCSELCNKVYSALRNYSDKNTKAKNETVNILTVGHSMVYGQGATANSYPIQLQSMLDSQYGSGKFRVTNIGIGGAVVPTFLEQCNLNRAENSNPDIVVILLGANEIIKPEHYPNFKDNYKQLVKFYQGLPSAPTVIMCTDVYMASRNVSKVVADEKVLAEDLSLPLVDLNKLTVETYNSDLEKLTEEYIDSGNYTDEATATAAAETAAIAKWFQSDKTHYTEYGYGIMAQGVFAALKNTYTDFNIEYADIKNVVCYDNDLTDSAKNAVEALVSSINTESNTADCMETYNALENVAKMYFKSNYNDSYIKLIDAFNKSLAETETDGFRTNHSAVLKADSYDLSSLSAYVAASEAYDALSDTAKRMLSDEKTKLDKAYEVIKPLAVESLVANGVNNASDYTADMLLAANSKINTYDYANRKNANKSQEEIISALKAKTSSGDAKKALTKIMCVGDSLTVASRNGLWNPIQPYSALLQDMLGEGYHVYNAGYSGATFYGSVNNYSATASYRYAKTYKPDIVIIMLGTNDFIVRDYLKNSDEDKVAQAYIDLINYFRGLESAPQVILATVPNCSAIDDTYKNRENYNKGVALQKRVAQDLGLPVLDMAALTADWPVYDSKSDSNYELDDKLHYDAVAYQEMAEYAYSMIKDITSENVYGYLRNTDLSTVKEKWYCEKYQDFLSVVKTPSAAEAVEMLKDYSRTDNLTSDIVNKSLAVFKNAGLTPSNNGGTIRSDTDKQNLAFYGKAPTSSNADLGGAYVSKIGAVMQTYNFLAQSGEKELTIESKDSTKGYISFAANDEVTGEFRFTLNGTNVSDRWGYGIVSRAFAEYTFDDGTTYILYSTDTDENNPSYATGDFVNGCCVRAVNDILKRMAMALKNASATYGDSKGETFKCGDKTVEKYNGIPLSEALKNANDEGILSTAQDTLYLLMGYKSVISQIS